MTLRATVAAVFDNPDLLAAVCRARLPPGHWPSEEGAVELKFEILRLVRSMLVNRAFAEATRRALVDFMDLVKMHFTEYKRCATEHLEKTASDDEELPHYKHCTIPHDDCMLAWHHTPEYAAVGLIPAALFGVPYHCPVTHCIGSRGALEQHLAIMELNRPKAKEPNLEISKGNDVSFNPFDLRPLLQ